MCPERENYTYKLWRSADVAPQERFPPRQSLTNNIQERYTNVVKDFFSFHKAVNDADMRIEGHDPLELFGEGFVMRTGSAGRNAIKITFDIDPLCWAVPPIGKTLALDLGSVHRMVKSVRRDPEGNILKLVLRTSVTPGQKIVEIKALPVLWHTRSEGVRHRRSMARSRRFTGNSVRPSEMALVR